MYLVQWVGWVLVYAIQPSLWLAFRYGEHGTATLVDFTSRRQQRLKREQQEAQQRDAYGEVTFQQPHKPKGPGGAHKGATWLPTPVLQRAPCACQWLPLTRRR